MKINRDTEHMRKTREIYRCNASEWKNFSYIQALEFKIIKATKAKKYYKSLASVADIGTNKYEEYCKLYEQSDKAIKFLTYELEGLNTKNISNNYPFLMIAVAVITLLIMIWL